MGLYKGFTGLARIRRTDVDDFYFRFLSADISRNQGINPHLPSYGGSELWRIISPSKGELSGRVSLLLCESQADDFYDLAYNCREFILDLSYYRRSSRTYYECRINTLSFSCKAGELVQINLDIVSTDDEKGTQTLSNTSNQKLITWDKTNVLGATPDGSGHDIQSFTYNIDNSLVSVRTANRFFPLDINRGIQSVTGNIVWFDSVNERRITLTSLYNSLDVSDATFRIDNLDIEHGIAHHWSYRTPLSPDIVATTLEWSKVSDLV